MAVDTTNLKKEIADSSKDVADLTKSVNKLISDSKTLSSSTLENSKDLFRIYGSIYKTVKDIYNTDKKNKLVEDALKNISNQRQEILNEVNKLKSDGLILDEQAVKNKEFELDLENQLLDKKIESLRSQLVYSGLLFGDDKKKFLENELRNLELKKDYNNIEIGFLEERKKAGDAHLNSLQLQDTRLKILGGTYSDLIKLSEKELQKQKEQKFVEEQLNLLKQKGTDLLGDQGKKVFNLGKGWVDVAKTGNVYLIALKVITDLLILAVDRFKELQQAGEDFRKETGLNLDQTKQLDKVALKLNQDYQQFGVGIKDAYNAAKDLMGEIGNVKVLDNNKKLVETTVLLSKNLGVASATGAKFLIQTMSLSGVSSNTASSYASYAGSLAKAAGVPLDRLMKDVAEASNETLSMVRGSTLELIKASAAALRMGVNLKTVSDSARSMLNFQSSIHDEMEASVLVGKNLNFMESRRLAYAGDIEGSAKSTLNTIKSAGEFQKMNMFQQEAIAKAAGMSVGDINKMLMMEKQLAQLTPAQRDEYERLTKLSKEKVETTGQDLLKQAKMQSILTNINNSFSKILNILSDKLVPVVELFAKVLEFAAGFLAEGGMNAGLVLSPMLALVKATTNLLGKLFGVGDAFSKIGGIFTKIGGFFTKIVTRVEAFFRLIRMQGGSIGKVIANSLLNIFKIGKVGIKAVPVIGWIITGIDLIWNLWKRFTSTMESDEWVNGSIWDRVLLGLKAVWGALYDTLIKPFEALYDTLIKPFEDVWNWLKERFTAESPSQLGLGIVEGIKAVGSMLFDVLSSPFKMLWNFVSELFPNMADFLVSAFKKGLDFVMKLPGVNWIMEKVGVKMPSTNVTETSLPEKETVNRVENDTNAQILSKLDELISLMKSGGIAVNIDGRRASELLAQASY